MGGIKELKLIYDEGGGRMTRNVPVSPEDHATICDLRRRDTGPRQNLACVIEEHFSKDAGVSTPMDIEWAKDGISGELFLVQARPETVQSQAVPQGLEVYQLKERGAVLVAGRSVGERIGQGTVRVISDASRLEEFREGEVLVTDGTDPDWEPTMKKAAARPCSVSFLAQRSCCL